MASLLSLSVELKLVIVEQLDHPSSSFIPAPSSDLLCLSKVCRTLRELTLPYIFRDLVLLNEESSGASVSAIVSSPHAELVRTLHYIGVVTTAGDPSPPSPDDLPDTVERALSRLRDLPNLKRFIVEFRYGKTKDEEGFAYQNSYEIGEEPEDDNATIELESMDAFRSMMTRSYKAIAQNPPSAVEDLELRNVVAKRSSAWDSPAFQELLKGLSRFTISLRGGDNGAGWRINTVPAYLDFVESLHRNLFEHMDNLKHLRISATEDGPPGLEDGMNNAALPIRPESLSKLESLQLDHHFISTDLAEWIMSHVDSLKSVQLNHCYSGLDENNWAQEVTVSWRKFFATIMSANLAAMRVFEVGPSDLETRETPKHGGYDHHEAARAKELREEYPGRRMFDYKTVDDKYGMLFDSELSFEMFDAGEDHAEWELLCAALGRPPRE